MIELMTKELKLLKYLQSPNVLDSIKGKPLKVLKAIDDFNARSSQHYMIVGPAKGKFIVEEIQRTKPKILIELGCFVGYSAVKWGHELSTIGGRYYGFEFSEDYADITRQVIEIAGLSSISTILVGAASERLPEFAKHHKPADFIFIDHEKSLYVPDFRVMESVGLIGESTTIVADNIIRPGAPEYHQYVNLDSNERETYNNSHENISGSSYKGKSTNLYTSQLIPVGQDAIEITKCLLV